MEKEEIIKGILYLLQEGSSSVGDGMGFTLLEIKEYLKLNNVNGYFEESRDSWIKLKKLINGMEEKGLIEERHFGGEGRVDYSIENPGIEIMEKTDKKVNLKSKWKILD